MSILKLNNSILENYFINFRKESSSHSEKLKQDWHNFYNKSFSSPRNHKTRDLLKQVSGFLPIPESYIADNVMVFGSLDQGIKDLILRAFIIADQSAFDFVKNHYGFSTISLNLNYIDEITSGNVLNSAIEKFKKSDYEYILAIGGGRTLDYAKFVSLKTGSKLLAIPSSLATHVYASTKIHALPPIKELGHNKTIDGDSAHLTLIDLKLLDKLYSSNKRLVFSGFGDIMAFINAKYDWKASSDLSIERDSEFVDKGIEYIINKLRTIDLNNPIHEWVEEYVFIQCLLCNITDWVGSAPASGAEHLFAKCIEEEVEDVPLHGEVVALGVLIFCFIRNKDLELVVHLLNKFNLSTNLPVLGLTKEAVVNGLSNSLAEGQRKNRYTLLNNIDTSKKYFKSLVNKMISQQLISE
jgi:glycerol-1-phosphate dehydrogenase [NAD(P)+]